MVGTFIYDLTDERMPDANDLMGGGREWKTRLFGESFDYKTTVIQKRILDNYLIDRPFRIALIYEGDTEDVVIKRIFEALHM